MRKETASLCSEKVADMDRNGWPGSIGTGGRLPPEQVAGIVRNEWPTSPEYAAGSVTYHAGRKSILKATNSDCSRTVELRVKTKQKGNWHTTSNEAKRADNPQNWEDETRFWIFVDMGADARYWIVPDLWLRNNIYEAHQQYLNKHGGCRPKNDNSNHHSIEENRLEEWQGAWEVLGIL